MKQEVKKIRRQVIILLTTLVFAFILCGAVSAADNNTTLNLTKGSTDNIGLDSNNVNTGPDHFLVQIHVNNTGNTTAHNVTGTFSFDSNVNNQYIYLDPQENATKYLGDIAPGASLDLFWLVNVNRTASAYLKDRNYTVTVSGNNTGSPNTITGDLIVQQLVSQNRNHVTSITLSTNNPNLGDTFAVTVVSDTSSAGFAYVDLSLINYDPSRIQPLSVNITYGLSTTNSILIPNPGVTDFVSVWIFRAIGAGDTPISALILDQSGQSYHYNTDVNSTTINLQVEPKADLGVTKVVDNSAPLVGSTVHFTLTVTNFGPNDATGVKVYDPLPAGLSYQSSSASQGSYDSGTGIWTINNLAVNQTVTLNITAFVTTNNTLINIANVTGNETDPNPNNNQAIVVLNPITPLADLGITKTVSTPSVHLEDVFTFTVTVFNTGPNTAHNVTVTDFWPNQLALLSVTPSQGTFNNATKVWTVGTLLPNAFATLTISAEGLTFGNFTNIVNVTGNETDPDPADNTANATINVHPHVDIAVTKTVDITNPSVTQSVIFTVAVTNLGPQDATGVYIFDPLPAGLIFNSANATQGSYNVTSGIWTIGNLAVNQIVYLDINVTVNQTGTIVNVATGFSNEHDHNQGNNQGVAAINALSTADLNIIKESDKTVYHNGDSVTYDFFVKNDGPNDATNVVVVDTLPEGLNFVSATNGGVWNSITRTVTWTFSTLTVGSNQTMEVIAQAVQTGFLTDIATVNATEFDPHTADNVAAVTIEVDPTADIAVNKIVTPSTQNFGQNATFTITVTNNGPDNATGVQLNDLLPAGLIYVSDDSGGAYNHLTGFWNIGNLDNGATATLNIIVTVNATGTFNNTAFKTLENEFDNNTSNDASSAILTVPAAADIAVVKNTSNSAPNVGQQFNYTITATNNGPDTATNVHLTDLIPAGLTFNNAQTSQGTYLAGDWNVGTLLNGASAWLKLFVTPTNSVAGASVFNTASLSSLDQYDWNTSNNQSTAGIGIPEVDLVMSKTPGNSTWNYGTQHTFNVDVTNNGPNTATNVVVVDTLPVGLDFVSATNGGVWNSTTRTVTWTIASILPAGNVHNEVVVNVSGHNTTVINTANVTADQYETNPQDNTGSATVNIPAQSSLYLTISSPTLCTDISKTALITFKVGNRGPDAAENVVYTWTIPEGIEFVSLNMDSGNATYDPATRTITWNLGTVPIGDPDLWVTVMMVKEGNYVIRPTLSTTTFDPNLQGNIEFKDICAEVPVVQAASKTIPMQKTGLPFGALLAAILMVIGGFVVPKRK